jgi:hypothetical protein
MIKSCGKSENIVVIYFGGRIEVDLKLFKAFGLQNNPVEALTIQSSCTFLIW